MNQTLDARQVGVGGAPFSVGRALGQAFVAFKQEFWRFLIVVAAANGLLWIIQTAVFAAARTLAAGTIPISYLAWSMLPLQFVIGSLLSNVVMLGGREVLANRRFALATALPMALRRLASALGARLLRYLLLGLLGLLLIVPMLIYACWAYVTLPACVLEGLGPWAGLRRSHELTKGYRWPIFGMLLLYWVGLALGLGARNYFMLSGVYLRLGGAGAFAVNVALELLLLPVGALLVTVVHRDLRMAKEGVGVERLAQVFD